MSTKKNFLHSYQKKEKESYYFIKNAYVKIKKKHIGLRKENEGGNMDSFNMEEPIRQELDQLLSLIDQDAVIQHYKALEDRAQNNQNLTKLIEEIKAAQKDAVRFAHYGKPEAEKTAIKQADAKTQEFNEHPLVVAYREQLIEANDLVQHVTEMIQHQINEELEKEGV
jgi:cell fate (sporulation/competence/biofilm development) regulator YmcA (YheA/YmcA/DUF963 family)